MYFCRLSPQKHDEMTQMGIDNINALLDSFMGINDSELAEQVIELLGCSNECDSFRYQAVRIHN